ncbi:hypothetical protein PPROV_000960200 [Pycnococcus provasolii]|uniref:Uncharacterized protein n=1 Tax=Pycnococcus provasolii TaxID=41880 RepID=A0A830HZL1_9CHLO|nr:hypothetical protein PPROV_000960200 [Pycnococcus provasolii]
MVLSERDMRAQSRAKGKRHAVPQARPRASDEKKAKRGEDPMLELAENAAAFSAGASASVVVGGAGGPPTQRREHRGYDSLALDVDCGAASQVRCTPSAKTYVHASDCAAT